LVWQKKEKNVLSPTLTTGVAKDFDWGERGPKWKNFVTFFCDIMAMTSLK